MSLFAFVIIHQGHERKEINLCLAASIDPPLENWDHFPRENFTTILRTDGFEALGAVDFAIKQVGNVAKGGSRIKWQPCDLFMMVVSTIPDNALLRKLRVLHPQNFGFFPKNSVLSR